MRRLKFARGRSLRLLPRLLLVFLLVLSPLYVIGLQINRSGTANVEREIASSLASRTELYMEMLDGDFESIRLSLQDLVNVREVLQLASAADMLSAGERTDAFLRVKERLDMLARSNAFAEEAWIAIPALGYTISSNRSGVATTDEDRLLALSAAGASPLAVRDGRLFLTLRYPDAATGLPALFLAAAEISKDRLGSRLAKFAEGGGSALLAVRNGEWAISSSTLPGETKPEPVDWLLAAPSADGFSSATVNGETYRVSGQDSRLFGIRFDLFVPEKDVGPALRIHKRWLALLSAASALAVIAIAYSLYRILHRPLLTLVSSFRKMEQGKLDQTVAFGRKDEFGYLYEQFNSMSKRLNVLVHEVYEQRYRAQSAELRHLQSQINPHFLYNTYFLLYRMAQREDNQNVMRLAGHLGEYFQYITRDGMEEVELKLEAAHSRAYSEIQAIRFGERIVSRFGDIPIEAATRPVPRLILQPIIENAFEHALEPKASGGLLEVSFRQAAAGLTISVEDNGERLGDGRLAELQQQLAHSEASESTGLINVHRRLRIRYGPDAGLFLSRSELGGLRAELYLPNVPNPPRGVEPDAFALDRGR